MDTQRLILFFVFSFSLLLLWEAWQKELRPPAPTPSTQGAVPMPSPPAGAAAGGNADALPAILAPAGKPREGPLGHTGSLPAVKATQGGYIRFFVTLKHKDKLPARKNLL